MVYITYKNKVECMAYWAREYKIPYQSFRYRISVNWPIYKALTLPVGANGKGKPRYIKYKGKKKPVSVFAKEYNIKSYNILRRINSGWTVHKALTIPINGYRKVIEYKGKSKTSIDWARKYNLSPSLLYKRLYLLGWTIEEALTIRPRAYKYK